MSHKRQFRSRTAWSAAIVFLSASGLAIASSITVEVHADTSASSGTAGNLQFLIQPPPNVLVTLSGFTTDATLTSFSQFGDVTGSFPGTVHLNGVGPATYDDYIQGITYGSFFDVFVTLDYSVSQYPANGPWLDIYAVKRVGNQNVSAVGTNQTVTDFSGDGIDYNTLISYDSQFVTVTPVTSGAPEPSTWAMVAGATGILGFLRRPHR